MARRKAGVSSNKCTGTTSSVGTTGGKGRWALKKGMYESSEDILFDYRDLSVCTTVILEKYDSKESKRGANYLADCYFAPILPYL